MVFSAKNNNKHQTQNVWTVFQEMLTSLWLRGHDDEKWARGTEKWGSEKKSQKERKNLKEFNQGKVH